MREDSVEEIAVRKKSPLSSRVSPIASLRWPTLTFHAPREPQASIDPQVAAGARTHEENRLKLSMVYFFIRSLFRDTGPVPTQAPPAVAREASHLSRHGKGAIASYMALGLHFQLFSRTKFLYFFSFMEN